MINPLPVVLADIRRSKAGVIAVVLLIALSVALGVAVSAQERGLRKGSARAADAFDLVIGSPGSQTQLVLTTVYLKPAALPLISGEVLARLQNEPGVAWFSPIAFGDFHRGYPVVGVTADFLTLGGKIKPGEGRVFSGMMEAVIGADVKMDIGSAFEPTHGKPNPLEEGKDHVHHEAHYTVVGRMPHTGTPWDRAITVPVEAVWSIHALGAGHAENHENEKAHDDEHEHAHEKKHHPAHLGPPWDAAQLPGAPAVVVKPKSFADAYRLRNLYRGKETMAVFPAEVLVDLYATLGDARNVLAAVAVGTQVLVVGSVLLAVFASLQQRRRRLAVLRALGASKSYVFAAVWLHVALMITAGAMLGLFLGWAGAWALSLAFALKTGVAMTASVAWPEIAMVLTLTALGMALALVPALAVYRQPVSAALRG